MNLANKDDDIELNSELIQHEDYITSLLTNRKSSRLYSADWAGVLHEWSHSKSKSKMEPNASGQSFQFRRYRIQLFNIQFTIDNSPFHLQANESVSNKYSSN